VATTDTSETGLESLIFASLDDDPADEPLAEVEAEDA